MIRKPFQISDLDSLVLEISEYNQNKDFAGLNWDRTKLQESLKTAQTLSIYQNLEPCAIIIYRVTSSEVVEIDLLMTWRKFQRQNLMQALFLDFLAQFKGFKEVWLEVHEKNQPARQLYQKLGFREIGRRPRYYLDGGAAIVCSLYL